MDKYMKPITKQLAIAAFILISVTVLSFGIRHVRFSAHRANTIESPVIADAEPDNYPDDSYTVDDEPDSQYADAPDSDEQAASEENTDSVKYDKSVSKTKSFKAGYAKSEGKKGLQKISLGDFEDLYRTGEGELWYVSKQPGGVSKMQVQINHVTGEITPIGGGYYGKSEGSQGLQRIPMGENDNIYITGDGELWYTSEQPDGSSAKVQLQEDITGGINIVDSGEK
jgi:hypothetical protein